MNLIMTLSLWLLHYLQALMSPFIWSFSQHTAFYQMNKKGEFKVPINPKKIFSFKEIFV